MTAPVLALEDLSVSFKAGGREHVAVDRVSLTVGRGEVLGLVGESGSGKSVTGLALMGLIEAPGRVSGGRILLEGRDIAGLPEAELRPLRGRRMAMIFQDPMTTLNPVLRVETQVVEAIRAHERVGAAAARARAREALVKVGIPAPDARLRAYPHQLSGGMRQRIAIAIALLHAPALLIADEPTTALDVTIQAQILAEAQGLCAEMGTALIWITHDLAVVAGLSDRLCVMYAGRIVEAGPVADVIEAPLHPYSAGLIASAPSRNARGVPLAQIPGMAPALTDRPPGCAFAPRCACATPDCAVPPPTARAEPSRFALCRHPLQPARFT
ncbi:ABC transporter ATP-binding protein [Methylobacterium sp. E-041]|uniref:ABC transporter ATP-binding protein n=1 Tax=Methylobacterium sp. E-041 TaxID=2836573 RepID=UPI001FBA6797|nr:ABC transporter ATP-binding protein [Methylobacterium sp. E-041]MCJ2106051.1 ABC transporter ATP-binding protein [Methylobacterium sp. E-041]